VRSPLVIVALGVLALPLGAQDADWKPPADGALSSRQVDAANKYWWRLIRRFKELKPDERIAPDADVLEAVGALAKPEDLAECGLGPRELAWATAAISSAARVVFYEEGLAERDASIADQNGFIARVDSTVTTIKAASEKLAKPAARPEPSELEALLKKHRADERALRDEAEELGRRRAALERELADASQALEAADADGPADASGRFARARAAFDAFAADDRSYQNRSLAFELGSSELRQLDGVRLDDIRAALRTRYQNLEDTGIIARRKVQMQERDRAEVAADIDRIRSGVPAANLELIRARWAKLRWEMLSRAIVKPSRR